jgi:acyl carrier protein
VRSRPQDGSEVACAIAYLRGMPHALDTPGQVRAILARRLAVEPAALGSEVPLATLPVDSLGLMEALCVLEDELGIRLPESNEFVATLRTVGDVIAAVESSRRAR